MRIFVDENVPLSTVRAGGPPSRRVGPLLRALAFACLARGSAGTLRAG